MAEAMRSLAKTFSRLLSYKDSGLTAPEDALSADKTLIDGLDGIAAERRADVWPVSKIGEAVQTFPKRNLRTLSMY